MAAPSLSLERPRPQVAAQCGLAHSVARTGLVLAAWYAFSVPRFVVVPFVIAFLYVLTLAVLERRWRQRVAASALVA